ncbi:DNA replication licensing factor mcm5 [Portunus trituberculatus]|uniref:DNA replication licensing factor MCM5 n=1 Tax=Portunus trituberculatus TaxID=210409 RepID=A0A5B7E2L4_PORTR|nr:DNA replication licensing factor mcm5 [Portunus trituberculatus]
MLCGFVGVNGGRICDRTTCQSSPNDLPWSSIVYRDALKRHYNLRQYYLEVNIEDVAAFDETLAEKLKKSPIEHIPLFESAATEVVDEITAPRPEGEEKVEPIQIMLNGAALPTDIRKLQSQEVSHLVKVAGIVVAASGVKAKAQTITIQCQTCRNTITNLPVKPGLEGYQLPRRCNTEQVGAEKCPLDPFFIVPDMCACVDYQVLKLQEVPENLPQGEMPRHLQIYVDRMVNNTLRKGSREKVAVGIRAPYLRAIGIQADQEGRGHSTGINITAAEEKEFKQLSQSDDVYERITKSIAPSIYGFEDIKKSVACLLFGGSRKLLPDGLSRRGDVNLLLLGDPGTAKSQLLKFVEKVAPIAVYTSGKGSSAAGLTASVIRDPVSRNFIMEGGAMVLADGGVVCIDEFDKMREDDRVAIHEAMEQQTISIAKAGITTTLNSRCSVMAAANSVFGRWDDTKGEENIDFMPTILSRFDMIYIVKDEHDEGKDTTLAKHVMNVHLNAWQTVEEATKGELSLKFLKKFISYCRRQLEAIIRISESMAKMRLEPFAAERDVNEALRLFTVSTLSAAMSGSLAGAEGFTTEDDKEMLSRIEKQLRRRFAVGSQVLEHSIVQDFVKQKYPERAVYKVLHFMIRRGELQHRLQRKMLYRINSEVIHRSRQLPT